MKVTVYGQNYTGAHFRGMMDITDSRDVKFVAVGEEKQIVDFVLNQFSYGPDESIKTFEDLLHGCIHGTIQIFDGCGGVYLIVNEQGEHIVDLLVAHEIVYSDEPADEDEAQRREWVGTEFEPFKLGEFVGDEFVEATFETTKWIDLGEVDVSQFEDSYNAVNQRLLEMLKEGKLELREGEDADKDVNAWRAKMNKE